MLRSRVIVFSVFLSLLLFLGHADAQAYSGKVVEVVDGDTLRVQHDSATESVRLLGVDSPELAQPYGPQAKEFTSGLVLNQEVKVEPWKPEPDGRVPAVVSLADGKILNREVLTAGLGWFCETDGAPDTELVRLSAKAIVGKVGLWADPAPLAPWDFRRDTKRTRPEPLSEQPASKPEETPKEKPKETPELKLKGEHEAASNDFLYAYKDNPVFQQFQPQWKTDENGNVVGLSAQNISSNPIAAVLGFQDGDVLQSVNGEMVTSEAAIAGLIGKLKGAQSIQVTILRNGQPQTITVPIPDLSR